MSLRTQFLVRCSLAIAACAAASALPACDPDAAQEEDLGSATAAIRQTPADVGCVRVTVTGVRTVVRSFDVTAGQSVVLNLNGLPFGLDSFLGEAFAGACNDVDDLSIPSWVSDPVSATVSPGAPPNVSLIFHRNGGASACVDWEDDTVTPAATLTSITLDPENASGATTNAPGAWSSSTGDPLSQILVIENGAYLNQGAATGGLGEISIPLTPGIHTYTLIGNGVFPSNLYYGAVLFFNGVATPPQVAVYNANASTGAFSVQDPATTIMGGANGGLFFDEAPGSAAYVTPDGITRVEVLSFSIDSTSGGSDRVSNGEIWADGSPDTIANLVLKVSSACP